MHHHKCLCLSLSMKVVISKQQMPLGLAPQASLVTTSMPLQEKLLNDEKTWHMESGAAIQQNVEFHSRAVSYLCKLLRKLLGHDARTARTPIEKGIIRFCIQCINVYSSCLIPFHQKTCPQSTCTLHIHYIYLSSHDPLPFTRILRRASSAIPNVR